MTKRKRERAPRELAEDELRQQDAEELPQREVMSTLTVPGTGPATIAPDDVYPTDLLPKP